MFGCATTGQIENQPLPPTSDVVLADGDLYASAARQDSGGITLIASFSGGGTRASALAFGVMEELRDTEVILKGKSVRLLDEIDFISSVSGGSFTAAYYGLYREAMFDDFKQRLLTRDLTSEIVYTLLNPLKWFSALGITDRATDIYADAGFGELTFADMSANGPPFIAINATDLSQGTRFTFVQDYFNLICSELASFPVARAVAASSAVPVLFDPVVLENYDTCDSQEAERLLSANLDKGTQTLKGTAAAALTYSDKAQRHYIHLIDGGITDNLGLRLILDTVELSGGIENYYQLAFQGNEFSLSNYFVILVVNASVNAASNIDQDPSPPELLQTIDAVTDAQLHLYNRETLELTELLLDDWVERLSNAGHPTRGYLINLELQSIQPDALNARLSQIPTVLGLPEEDVNLLINAGRQLLRENEEFKRLKSDIAASTSADRRID